MINLLDLVLPVREPVGKEFVKREVPVLDVPDEEYLKVANRLGVTIPKIQVNPALTVENLLSEMGLLRYNEDQVRRYLNKQYGKVPWGWRALRRMDYVQYSEYTGTFIADDRTINDGATVWRRHHNGKLIGNRDSATYNKPIPYPVLLTVDRISEAFPKAGFFVSDEMRPIASNKLDPFLMVVHPGLQYIIERWDEPKFRA